MLDWLYAWIISAITFLLSFFGISWGPSAADAAAAVPEKPSVHFEDELGKTE